MHTTAFGLLEGPPNNYGAACLKIVQKLCDNLPHVVLAAHGEEQIQAAPPDRDIRVLQAVDDALPVPAQRILSCDYMPDAWLCTADMMDLCCVQRV